VGKVKVSKEKMQPFGSLVRDKRKMGGSSKKTSPMEAGYWVGGYRKKVYAREYEEAVEIVGWATNVGLAKVRYRGKSITRNCAILIKRVGRGVDPERKGGLARGVAATRRRIKRGLIVSTEGKGGQT